MRSRWEANGPIHGLDFDRVGTLSLRGALRATKQSRRHKRAVARDCFASLAMTNGGRRIYPIETWTNLALLGHEPVFAVGCDGGGFAVGGVAPTAASAGFEDQDVAGADCDAGFLGLDRARRLSVGI